MSPPGLRVQVRERDPSRFARTHRVVRGGGSHLRIAARWISDRFHGLGAGREPTRLHVPRM